jgi:hypothetical protein
MGLLRKCDVENTVVHAAKSISCKIRKRYDLRLKKGKVPSVFKHCTMKAYGGVDVWTHVFLTSALVAGEWSRPALPSGKKPPVPIGKVAGWAPEPVWTLLRRYNGTRTPALLSPSP